MQNKIIVEPKNLNNHDMITNEKKKVACVIGFVIDIYKC